MHSDVVRESSRSQARLRESSRHAQSSTSTSHAISARQIKKSRTLRNRVMGPSDVNKSSSTTLPITDVETHEDEEFARAH